MSRTPETGSKRDLVVTVRLDRHEAAMLDRIRGSYTRSQWVRRTIHERHAEMLDYTEAT